MCVRKSGLSPWIKSMILKLFFRSYYESFPFRKCNKIENRTHGASSNITGYTLSVPICCIVVPGPFPLQPYYSRGKNIKFYSTSHVNTFLRITNDRGHHCHSEKTSRSSKKTIFSDFVIFFRIRHFFQKMCKTLSALLPWIKSINILFLIFAFHYE